jgi:lipopolysaccharide heptosyltransferase II
MICAVKNDVAVEKYIMPIHLRSPEFCFEEKGIQEKMLKKKRIGLSQQPLLVMAFGAKGVGDHVSCSSFVRNLAQNCPESPIDFAAFSPIGAELFRHNPYIRTIHVLDMTYLKLGGQYTLGDKLRYLNSFQKANYQKVYVLGTKFRHAVFAFLTGAKKRIGYDNYHRGFLLTKTGPEPRDKNIVHRFLGLLTLDGCRIYDPSIELFLSEHDQDTAERIFKKYGILENQKVICMAPFAADMRRTWGLERFQHVAQHFVESRGVKVVILGSSNDQQCLVADPFRAHTSIINLAGQLNIRETAAVIKKSAVFLGNDSGLGHVAGAVGTPAVILGYFITRTWYPLAPSVHTVIKDTGCISCDLNTCDKVEKGKPHCILSITPDEVIAKITKLLN